MRKFLISRIEATLLFFDRIDRGRPRLARLTVYPALALVLFREKIDPYRPVVALAQEDQDLLLEQIGPVQLMEHPGGGYSLAYYAQGEASETIEQRGGQGGGYSWEALVRAVLEMRDLDPSPLTFDPEADMLAVYAPDPDVLRRITEIIIELSANREMLDQAVAYAEQNGFFS